MRGDLARKVGLALSPGGPLSGAMKGYEPRPGQLRMALAWADALEASRILVAEAATGIGKTLAYLVPAVLSGRKTIVSTGTKTLQPASPTTGSSLVPATKRNVNEWHSPEADETRHTGVPSAFVTSIRKAPR